MLPGPRFDWDARKSAANERKHGISFKEAETAFADEHGQITIRLDDGTIGYFKELAEQTGIPYQTLINLYLRECAASRKKLTMDWRSAA